MVRAQNEVIAEKAHHHHHDAGSEALLRSKMFYAQRNMYLTGFTLFLSLILNRFYYLICDVIKQEERYQTLLKKSQSSAKPTEPTGQKSKDNLALTTLQTDHDRLKQDYEILKKQAQQNEKEYMALSDRYNALEKKSMQSQNPLTSRNEMESKKQN
ncbi:hypothetical protein HMI54_012284 [Coelomomyces lativittatus]|nr:hypothetical protein HMI54_012284 [Coelomomyces lativittatus]